MRSAAIVVPSRRADHLAVRRHPGAQGGVGEQPVDGAEQLVVGEVVGVEPHAEAELVHPLRVVVLVPEQRQHDHRLAEVERLGGRVVAAVGDHEVDERDDRSSAAGGSRPTCSSGSSNSSARGPFDTM